MVCLDRFQKRLWIGQKRWIDPWWDNETANNNHRPGTFCRDMCLVYPSELRIAAGLNRHQNWSKSIEPAAHWMLLPKHAFECLRWLLVVSLHIWCCTYPLAISLNKAMANCPFVDHGTICLFTTGFLLSMLFSAAVFPAPVVPLPWRAHDHGGGFRGLRSLGLPDCHVSKQLGQVKPLPIGVRVLVTGNSWTWAIYHDFPWRCYIIKG